MDKNKAVSYLESSFLAPLLKTEGVTDISFNGEDIYYVDNAKGRIKSDIIVDQENASDFIRQIANLVDKQFSYTTPYLDISLGRYRLLAVHQSISRIKDNEGISFSIRLASYIKKINNQSDFLSPELVALFKTLIDNSVSIVIGGVTGSGKTEFQKYLISLMNVSTRVIIIDNVLELENVRNENIDITTWQIDEKNQNASASLLIRAALRCNPDWLIVAEARGQEMIDVLNSAMTGLPIITTLHAKSAETMPDRIASLVMMNEKKLNDDNVRKDISSHFNFYVHLTKEMDNSGNIKRFIDSVMFSFDNLEKIVIYERNKNKQIFRKINIKTLKLLNISHFNDLFFKTFVEENNE